MKRIISIIISFAILLSAFSMINVSAAGGKTYYLFGYINGADYADKADAANMGVYRFVNNQITVNFSEDTYVGVKEEGNANWYMTNGWQGKDTTSVTLYNTNDLGKNADKMYIPPNVEITLYIIENSNGTLTLWYDPADIKNTDHTDSYGGIFEELQFLIAQYSFGVADCPENYTPESFAVFKEAYDYANSLYYDDTFYGEATYEEAYNRLLSAYNSLVRAKSACDKLRMLVAEYSFGVVDMLENYTPESYMAFMEAYRYANKLLSDSNTIDAQYEEAYQSLLNARNNLVSTTITAEQARAYLEQAIQEASRIPAGGAWTKESKEAYIYAMDFANDTYSNDFATANQLMWAAHNLMYAYNNLEYFEGDKAELWSLIEKLEKVLSRDDAESLPNYNELKDLYVNARGAYHYADSQEELDEYRDRLKAVLSALEGSETTNPTESTTASSSGELSQEEIEAGYIFGSVIVSMKYSYSLGTLLDGFEIEEVRLLTPGSGSQTVYLVKFKEKTKEIVWRAIGVLNQSPYVLCAEPDYIRTLPVEPPNMTERERLMRLVSGCTSEFNEAYENEEVYKAFIKEYENAKKILSDENATDEQLAEMFNVLLNARDNWIRERYQSSTKPTESTTAPTETDPTEPTTSNGLYSDEEIEAGYEFGVVIVSFKSGGYGSTLESLLADFEIESISSVPALRSGFYRVEFAEKTKEIVWRAIEVLRASPYVESAYPSPIYTVDDEVGGTIPGESTHTTDPTESVSETVSESTLPDATEPTTGEAVTDPTEIPLITSQPSVPTDIADDTTAPTSTGPTTDEEVTDPTETGTDATEPTSKSEQNGTELATTVTNPSTAPNEQDTDSTDTPETTELVTSEVSTPPTETEQNTETSEPTSESTVPTDVAETTTATDLTDPTEFDTDATEPTSESEQNSTELAPTPTDSSTAPAEESTDSTDAPETTEPTEKSDEQPTESVQPTTSATEQTEPTTTPKVTAKKANKMKVTVKKTKTVKAKKLKKAKVTVKAITVKKSNGTVTFKKVAKKSSKRLTINKKTGKITVKKGTKPGTYKIKVKITAEGTKSYEKKTVIKTIRIKVRK